jgi:hypothetical protein
MPTVTQPLWPLVKDKEILEAVLACHMPIASCRKKLLSFAHTPAGTGGRWVHDTPMTVPADTARVFSHGGRRLFPMQPFRRDSPQVYSI